MQEPQLAKIDISTDGKIIVSRKPFADLDYSIHSCITTQVIWQEIIITGFSSNITLKLFKYKVNKEQVIEITIFR